MIPQGSPGAGSAPSLRPYQHGIVGSVLGQLEIVRSTLVVAATGTGKTVCFSELARIYVQRGGRALILVHRDELISQARRKCEAVGLWPDVEKGKQRANTLARVVLASVQSLKGPRLARWARDHFAVVIVDEAHHSVATSYRTILDHFSGAKIIGVTATPDRADGQGLNEVFESVAYRYEIRQAIDEGYLVPIVARRIVVDSVDLSAVAVRAGDFAQDQLAGVMGSERALQGQARPLLELARERSTIVFCVDVAHARALAATLNSHRHGCARMVSGETDEDDRRAILEGHAAGEFQFLTNCDVLTEGYDAPSCSCVAMCRPTKSRGRFVQGAGRGLRPHPESGKRDCLILDFTGTAGRHSLIGPADCLAAAGELADDVRDEIERLTESAQLEIGAVIAQAEEAAAARRAQLRVSAVVRFHEENIDPFIGAAPRAAEHLTARAARDAWRAEPPSQAQIQALEKRAPIALRLPAGFTRADAWDLLERIRIIGVATSEQLKRGEAVEQGKLLRLFVVATLPADKLLEQLDKLGVTLSKLPAGISPAEKWDLLQRLQRRTSDGLCSYKMARRLTQLGVKNASTISYARGEELKQLCLRDGWHPRSLRNEPEVIGDALHVERARAGVG